jgi:hypothetical protein
VDENPESLPIQTQPIEDFQFILFLEMNFYHGLRMRARLPVKRPQGIHEIYLTCLRFYELGKGGLFEVKINMGVVVHVVFIRLLGPWVNWP